MLSIAVCQCNHSEKDLCFGCSLLSVAIIIPTVLQSKRATFLILRINAHKVQTLKY